MKGFLLDSFTISIFALQLKSCDSFRCWSTFFSFQCFNWYVKIQFEYKCLLLLCIFTLNVHVKHINIWNKTELMDTNIKNYTVTIKALLINFYLLFILSHITKQERKKKECHLEKRIVPTTHNQITNYSGLIGGFLYRGVWFMLA